jgi:pyridoxine 5-phosphate synthase
MTRLSVNVNKVALLRNTRALGIPSVTRAARLSLDAGAAGITVHPRPDQRHIIPQDVYDLSDLLRSEYPEAEFNIEGNPFHNLMDIVRRVKPDQCTLVPDDPGAFTSDHGWDITANQQRLKPVIEELHDLGCRVSLFMDPFPEQIERIPEVGADRIELYTEPYAAAFTRGNSAVDSVLPEFAGAARKAQGLGLGVNAGHDLNLDNLTLFCRTVPNVLEVSIGHALIADALETGIPATVKAYIRVLEAAE